MPSPRALAAPFLLAGARALRAVLPAPAGAFRTMLFHDVSPAERDAFTALVQALSAAGRLITPAEAEALLAGGTPRRPGPPPCLLSFDDGFASNLEVAETVLAPLGVQALFFVCPGLTALSGAAQQAAIAANVFDGKRDAGDLRILGWNGVERLAALGHTIGSHTRDHKRLTVLTAEQRAEQIDGAADLFQRHLGAVPAWFAYTFGDAGSIDAASLAAIARRHRYCRSGVRGLNHARVSPYAVRADHVDLLGGDAWRWCAVEGALDPLYRQPRALIDGLAAGL